MAISGDNRFPYIVAERFDMGLRLGGDVAKGMVAVRKVNRQPFGSVSAQATSFGRPRHLIERGCKNA